jgi:hypothetical protein
MSFKVGDKVRATCTHGMPEDCRYNNAVGVIESADVNWYTVDFGAEIGRSNYTASYLTLVDELSPLEKLEAAIRVAAEAYDRAIYNAQQADKTLEAVKERLNHLEQAKATLESL